MNAQQAAHLQQMQVIEMKKNRVYRAVQTAAIRFGTNPLMVAAALEYIATSPVQVSLADAINHVTIAKEVLND